jgi:hypothetical protein
MDDEELDREERYEVIVRHHILDRKGPSVKSRRFNIYQRVFEKDQGEAVITSVEKALNGTRSNGPM